MEEEYNAEMEEAEEDEFADQLEEANDIVNFGNDVLDAGRTVGRLFSKVIPTHRQCSVCISNECPNYMLCNPRTHIDSGCCADPLPPTIKPSSSGKGLFTKTAYAMRGSGGVFTYDLLNTYSREYAGKMAILFKVPFDLNLRSIYFAVGVMDMDTECNKHLFHEMYTATKPTFVRGKASESGLTFQSSMVTVRATMSDSASALIKIEVSNY